MARRPARRGIAKKRVKWNIPGFEDIRRLPGVESEVAKVVSRVAASASAGVPGGYEHGTEDGGDRVRGYVVTVNGAAIRAEAADHVLQRALMAAKSGPQDPGAELVDYVTRSGKTRRVTRRQADAWAARRKS